MHGLQPPSDWVCRWSHLVPAGGTVLDVACGAGRHMRWFARLGHVVTGVDRDPGALAFASAAGRTVQADIENGPWPFAGETFDALVVTNYLWRPLWPALLGSLAPGGVLLYETFAEGNETVGKPSRPDFLLRHGELLELCRGLRIVAYEDGYLDDPPRFVQRAAAVRMGPADGRARYRLQIESAIPERTRQ
ncbi:class I SAM-dependent methyltransferase [Ramlibacter sp.]|uniref:class I SAM-dependent methyltransferase n=1 Tax=Ramlibacter sp. TaxID=1917967 RepID=UPI002FCC8FF1